MQAPRLGLALQALMRMTDLGEPHCAPTPPAVLPRRCGTGHGLAHLALMAPATGPVITLHDMRMDDVGAEKSQDMLQTRFALRCMRSS
jgi:hypothetical protein